MLRDALLNRSVRTSSLCIPFSPKALYLKHIPSCALNIRTKHIESGKRAQAERRGNNYQQSAFPSPLTSVAMTEEQPYQTHVPYFTACLQCGVGVQVHQKYQHWPEKQMSLLQGDLCCRLRALSSAPARAAAKPGGISLCSSGVESVLEATALGLQL